jgi:hypothetical protein
MTKKQAGVARLVTSRILCMVKKNGLIVETRPLSKCYLNSIKATCKPYLSETQLITLKLLVWLLSNQKQVKIERLAATLPLPIQQNSRRRHIQRFLNLRRLSVVILWFPLIKEIITRRISQGKQLIIALDRTQWQENNIMKGQCDLPKTSLAYLLDIIAKKRSQ